MIISDSRRFVFVHVQKTGGSTLSRLLKKELDFDDVRSVGKRHAPLSVILNTEPALAGYWIFGFVRDPWDRMVSWWSMIDSWRTDYNERGIPLSEKSNPFFRRCAKYDDFEAFVLQGTEELPRLRRPQISYLHTRRRQADFIGRTESFAVDAAQALHHVGMTADRLGHYKKNKSEYDSYRSFYNDATRKRIEAVFARDIVEFDYRF